MKELVRKNKKKIIALLLVVMFIGIIPKAAYSQTNNEVTNNDVKFVYIKDKNLKEELEKEIQKLKGNKVYNNSNKISKEDMNLITNLDINNKEIKDLTGLEFANNLKSINLDGNEIKDISCLSNLKSLKNISAKNQKIKLNDFKVSSDSLTISNPIIGLDKTRNINISGKDISVKDDKITINNINPGNGIKINFKDAKSKEDFSGEISFNVIGERNLKIRYTPDLVSETKSAPNTNVLVNFADNNLKREINRILGNTTDLDAPIWSSQMRIITFIDLPHKNFSSIEGLQYAANLENLFLNYNNITDISPLSGLKKLKVLSLSYNNISNISALGNNKSPITTINLSGNNIKDISALRNFKNLTDLDLSFNYIYDLTPLKGLSNINRLSLSGQTPTTPKTVSYGSIAVTPNPIKGVNGEVVDITMSTSGGQYNPLTNNFILRGIYAGGINRFSGRFEKSVTLGNATARFSGSIDIPITYQPDRVINIIDTQFRRALNRSIHGVTNNSHDNDKIMASQLVLLNKISRNNVDNIQDLTGIDICAELTEIDLKNEKINSLNPLLFVKNLRKLDFSNNSISDIEVLKNLSKLTSINLNQNNISDISALSGLTNLEELHLGVNRISDISAVSNLTNLRFLWMNYNQVEDISVLSRLNKLEGIGMNNNKINDIRAVSNLTKLTELYFENNKISDISSLARLNKLLHLSVNAQKIQGNEITSIGSTAIVDNTIKGLNGEFINIENRSNYTYDSETHKVTFNNINATGNQEYTFNKSIRVGSATANFSGNVTQTIIYRANPTVNIQDDNLKLALNKILKRPPTADITIIQLEGLTGTIDLSGKEITNLEGIQYAKNITGLNAGGNKISDLNPLKSMSRQLNTLLLSYNQISDVSPLSDYKYLRNADLSNQNIQASEITTSESIAIVDNITKGFTGAVNHISNGPNYTYNSATNKITFKGINATGERSYRFLYNGSLGSIFLSFSGKVTQKVIYNPDPIINIRDTNLKIALNEILKRSPTADIHKRQLEGLTGIITMSGKEITNLEGIQYAKNITGLSVPNNRIISLDPLRGMINIKSLNINNNPGIDISGIDTLNLLETLNIRGDRVELSQLNNLERLRNLNELDLGDNGISDLNFLRNLTSLDVLSLDNNKIVDISPIRNIISSIQNKRGSFSADNQTVNITEGYNIGSEFTLGNIIIGKDGGKEPVINILPSGTYNSTTGEITWNRLEDSSNLSYGWKNTSDKYSGTVNVKLNQVTDVSALIEIPSEIKMEDLQDENAPDIDPTNRPGVKPTVYNMVGATTPITLITDPSITLKGNFKIYTDPIFRVTSVSSSSNYVPVSVYKDFNTKLTNSKDPLMILDSSNKQSSFTIKAIKSEFKGSYDKYTGIINFTIDYSK